VSEILNRKNFIYIFKHLISVLIFVLGIEVLKYLFNVFEPESNRVKDEFISNFIFSFFGVIVLSPIIEEMVFRLPLKKNGLYLISVFFSLIFLISSSYLFVKIILSLFVGNTIFHQSYSKSVLVYWILVGLSIFAFVSIHFENFDSNDFKNLDFINISILFLPHLFLAVILTKIRLQTCFTNAVVFHSLYNLIILSLALLFNF